jgi:hypothetical protein
MSLDHLSILVKIPAKGPAADKVQRPALTQDYRNIKYF